MNCFRNIKFYLLSIAAVFILTVGCTTAPMQYEISTDVQKDLSTEQLEKAVVKAALERNWTIQKEKENEFFAKMQLRQHMVEVKLKLQPGRVDAEYVDSKNMDYDGERIHKKYYTWVDKLLDDIKKNSNETAMNVMGVQ